MGQADRTLSLLSRLSHDAGDLHSLLAPGRVIVFLDPDVATKPQAQLIFTFAVNLLARLSPVVQDLHIMVPRNTPLKITVPRWGSATLDQHMRVFLSALGPPLQWRLTEAVPSSPDCSLIVGVPSRISAPFVLVGSNNWEVFVSPSTPVYVGKAENPVGAYAAACLGVGEVWKHLLRPHQALLQGTPVFPLTSPLAFSTYTYRAVAGEPNPSLPPSVSLDRLTIVGLGAGGGAAAFTLASLANLEGSLNLVEGDEVTDTNLNRYVFADATDAAPSQPKTTVIRGLFTRFPALRVRAFPWAYAQAVAALSREDHRYVLAAVHSRAARRELQYETPGTLWDAGATEHGDFFVWRRVLGMTECMWCKYPPGEEDPEQQKAEQLTQLLGLDVATWMRKLRNNETFQAEELAAIAGQVDPRGATFALPALGQRYGDWEASQCGRLPLPEVDDEIPVPFAPVMAGVLLAGEVIKESHFPAAVLDSYYWNTLVGTFLRHTKPHRKVPRPDCRFCHDPASIGQYQRRWGAT